MTVSAEKVALVQRLMDNAIDDFCEQMASLGYPEPTFNEFLQHVSDTVKGRFMKWTEYPFRINEAKPTRLMYGDGDNDWIGLTVPILAIGVGPLGVTMQCADGSLYILWSSTTPSDVNNGWTVNLVWKR